MPRSKRCARSPGALIAIVLVLCSVFVPVAFLGGIAGQLYKQFAVTVTVAVVISGFTALTLTPAICALLLKEGEHESKIFHPFNVALRQDHEVLPARRSIRRSRAGSPRHRVPRADRAAWCSFSCVCPRRFVPTEDQGYLIGSIIMPDAASLQRTQKTGAQLWDVLSKDNAIKHAFVVPGRDFIGGANKTSAGTTFVLLKDWDDRKRTAQQVAADLNKNGPGLQRRHGDHVQPAGDPRPGIGGRLRVLHPVAHRGRYEEAGRGHHDPEPGARQGSASSRASRRSTGRARRSCTSR